MSETRSTGIVYSATRREHYVLESFLSAHSIKDLAPDLPITLFTDMPQLVYARGVDGDFVFGGEAQIPGDDLGIIDGHFIVYDGAAERDLHTVEAQAGGQRHGFGFSAKFEIPIGDPDAKLRGAGKQAGTQGKQAGGLKKRASGKAHVQSPSVQTTISD